MYLSDLEIFGFKSFGKKTKLKFTDGLTCVVGPNGCGKTNIVDGIRWVLGEQRSSVMRSDTMDNVIFNGNAKRKPLGMAEVVMTIQNNKNILPVEYSEVQITRRLFRDGNSNYLINGQRSRLKDIHNLFMDTGMGANSYSVIELKMVEAILSGKAEERRQLLEEAAGVVRYKTRRKEASRKLNSVQLDLERLSDIEVEVGKQVNSLQRQASKTRRYNEYVAELRQIELHVLARDYQDYIEKQNAFQAQLNDTQKENNKYEFMLTDKENELLQLKSNLSATQEKLALIRGKRENLKSEIAQNEKKFAVANEKNESVNRNSDRIQSEMLNSSNIRENAEKSLAAAKARLERYGSDIQIMDKEKADALGKVETAKRELEAVRALANKAANELGSLQSSLSNSKSMIARLEQRSEDLNKRSEIAGEQIQAFDSSALELSSNIKMNEQKLSDTESKLKTHKEELARAVEQKDGIKNEIDEKNTEISALKSELNNQKSTLKFYESLVDSDNISEFMRGKDWKAGKVQQLAELIAVDDKYIKAIGSLFSEISNYFIVADYSEVESGIAALKNANKGKANFIIEDKAEKTNTSNTHPNSISVMDVLRIPDNLKGFIEARYHNTIIVETDAEAKEYIEANSDRIAVTIDGSIYSSDGRVRGGSEISSEGMLIGKQEKIDTASKSIANLETQLIDHQSLLAELIEARNKIDLNQLKFTLNSSEKEVRTLTNDLAQLKLKKDGIGSRIEVLEESIDKNNEEKNSNQLELNEFRRNLNEAEDAIAAKSKQLDKLTLESEEEAKIVENASRELREKELEFVRLNGEVSQAKKDTHRLERSLSDMAVRIRTGKDEILELNDMAIAYAKEIEYARTAVEEGQIELAETENQFDEIDEQRQDVQTAFQQSERELKETRLLSEKIKENLHKKEIELSEVNLRIAGLEEKAMESHETDVKTIDISSQESEHGNLEEARKRVQELKQKLQNIGSVNFMALEEYEETKERHSFMVEQIADLTESEQTLQQTIEEINETAEKLFIDTFGKIRDNFRELFNSLFDGDAEADLKLVGENPLESDIEITAKPPGKKPHSIEMLSGGEKTLTAISLLFAIYMVKPSPFCILDEVDAPLDDANIGRFVSLLRRFAGQTQFLIVTHNKKTMEAADNLYGVTQQEMGLSQVVSVKIDGKKGAA